MSIIAVFGRRVKNPSHPQLPNMLETSISYKDLVFKIIKKKLTTGETFPKYNSWVLCWFTEDNFDQSSKHVTLVLNGSLRAFGRVFETIDL